MAALDPPMRLPGRRFYRSSASPSRLAFALGAMAVVTAILLKQEAIRRFEAMVSSWTTAHVTGITSDWIAGSSTYIIGRGTKYEMGLQLVAGCSTALLIIPLIALAALYVYFGRAGALRMVVGVVVCSAAMFAVNLTRLAVVAIAVRKWGTETGFEWAHSVVGSVIVLIGWIAVLLAFTRFVRWGSSLVL
jgi:exosortase/archaeosortase family protein